MARNTAQIPDEITIQGYNTSQLQTLAVDLEILHAVPTPTTQAVMDNAGKISIQPAFQTNYTPTIQETELRKVLVTVRALTDGRQFSISMKDLLRLQKVILPNLDVSNLSAPQLALQCAYFFDGR